MQEDKIAEISRLVAEHESELCRYAVRLLRDSQLAKDAVQEAFIQYLRNSQGKASVEVANARAWLFKATRNKCLDILKSARHKHETTDENMHEWTDESPAPDEIAEKNDMMEIVRKKLASLPERDRELLCLKLEHGRSYKEISEITGLSISNVGFILHTAIKRLARELQQEGIIDHER
ncbi:MAG: RNA polymerase sigma factor [Candidatus Nanoarchaeia archaeon]